MVERLVGKHTTTEALAETKNVPIASEDHDGDLLLAETVLQLQVEVDVVDPAHVTATRGTGVLGVQGERVHVDEAVGDVRVVLVGLHQTEPRSRLGREARLVVEVERRRDDRVAVVDAGVVEPVVATLVALAADAPDELEHRVVEVELHTHL